MWSVNALRNASASVPSTVISLAFLVVLAISWTYPGVENYMLKFRKFY